jgi:hypothetical protein
MGQLFDARALEIETGERTLSCHPTQRFAIDLHQASIGTTQRCDQAVVQRCEKFEGCRRATLQKALARLTFYLKQHSTRSHGAGS